MARRSLVLAADLPSTAARTVLGEHATPLGPPREGRRAAKAKQQELAESRPVRSLVAARLPNVQQIFSPGTTFAQYLSLSGFGFGMS